MDGLCDGVDNPGDNDITYTDATLTHMALPAAALTVTLGLEGGVLASGEDQIGYTFPANTFTDTVVFTHAPRHPLSMPLVVALAHINRAFANYAVLLDTATLVSPTQPYSLSITYNEGDLTTDEATLALYYWEGGAWVVEPTGVLNTTTNTITAQPDRVGWWAVLGEARRQFLPLVYRE